MSESLDAARNLVVRVACQSLNGAPYSQVDVALARELLALRADAKLLFARSDHDQERLDALEHQARPLQGDASPPFDATDSRTYVDDPELQAHYWKQRAETAERERDEARENTNRQRGFIERAESAQEHMRQERNLAWAERDAARAALATYGSHRPPCALFFAADCENTCTCGLTDTLNASPS